MRRRYFLPALGLALIGLSLAPGFQAAETGDSGLRVLWSKPAPGSSYSNTVCFSPDGRVVAAGVGKVVHLWDAAEGALLRTVAEPDTPRAGGVSFSPDGLLLGTGRMKPQGNEARLWEAASGKLHRTLKTPRQVSTVTFAPRGSLYATSGYGEGVILWDWRKGEVVRILGPDVQIRFSLAFSPDGERLAAPTVRPHAVRVWDTRSGEQLVSVTEFATFVNAVAFSPDGSLLAAASRDGTVRLLRVPGGTEARRLEVARAGKGPDDLNAVAFSPDGRYLIAGGALTAADGRREESLLRVWRTGDGAVAGERHSARGERIEGLAAAPSGKSFAYARSDGEVGLVELPR